MANRIYFANQQVAFKPDGSTSWNVAHGVQSVAVTTTFNLEQAFEIGQLSIYENIEGTPDVEVTLEKVLDGYPLIYHMATVGIDGTAGGSGLAGRVEVVNGGFRLEADSLEEGRIIMEDTTDDMVVMEDATNSSLGDVVKVLITNSGYGYASLPTVTISTSTGTGGVVFPVSSGVGKVLSVKNVDQGFSYETAPTLSPRLHMQIDTLSSSFTDGETISATAEDNIILESADALDGDISLED